MLTIATCAGCGNLVSSDGVLDNDMVCRMYDGKPVYYHYVCWPASEKRMSTLAPWAKRLEEEA